MNANAYLCNFTDVFRCNVIPHEHKGFPLPGLGLIKVIRSLPRLHVVVGPLESGKLTSLVLEPPVAFLPCQT